MRTVFNFFTKDSEVELYNKLKKQLIKKGYIQLNNTKCYYSFDCKKTKKSNKPEDKGHYPYSIKVSRKKIQNIYSIAA